jgi:protein TonB
MHVANSNIIQTSARDRFQACIFLSVVVHMFIIFGIIFTQSPQKLTNFKTLNITIARHKTDKQNEKFQYFAQAEQLAGGTKDTRVTDQTPQVAILAAASIPMPTNLPSFKKITPQSNEKLNTVHTSSKTHFQQTVRKHNPEKNVKQHQTRNTQLRNNRSAQIAAISAKIAELQIAQSKSLRHRTISVATHEARDAAYLDFWRKKIEYVGNINYPGEARRKSLHGSLRMLVALNTDGSIKKVQIRKSSGIRVLDDAALQIVKLASPFPPLPKEISKDTDILEIIRTWEFTNGKLTATG